MDSYSRSRRSSSTFSVGTIPAWATQDTRPRKKFRLPRASVLSLILFNLFALAFIRQSARQDALLTSPFGTGLSRSLWTGTSSFDGWNSSSSTYATSGSGPSMGTCEPCLLDPDDEKCRYGIDNVRLSRAYEGSGYRVRKFLEKAISGEKVTIAVLGASVSTGHGLDNTERIWHQRFFRDFKSMFPNSEFVYGAVPATDSLYYSYCHANVVGYRQIDLYLVELDINNPSNIESAEADDALYRAILSQPHQPAMIRASVFALNFADLVRGYTSTFLTSQHFDVPVITTRFLMPHLIRHPDKLTTFFATYPEGIDMRHMNERGHDAMGDMLSLYMREQVCRVKRDAYHRSVARPVPAEWPQPTELLGTLPRIQLFRNWSDTAEILPPISKCQLAATKTLDPMAKTGQWDEFNWNDKRSLATWTKGSTISFAFRGTSCGILLWRHNGAHTRRAPGYARCWLEESLASRTASGTGSANGKADRIGEQIIDSRWSLENGNTDVALMKDVKLDRNKEYILTCQFEGAKAAHGPDKAEFRLMGFISQ